MIKFHRHTNWIGPIVSKKYYYFKKNFFNFKKEILPVLGEGALAISKEQGFFVTAMSVSSHRKFSFSEGNVSREADGTISIV